jgi:serine/threonine protein kinase/tetratricopeptide (TPR) repeat protein
MPLQTPSLRELFEASVGLPAGERNDFLDAHCPDAGRRQFVERMLQANAEASVALPKMPAETLAQALGDPAGPVTLPPGSRIGPFELVEVIGEGGSSTVFRAARTVDGVRQEVALKLLRRGLYSPDAQRQFRRERQVLSQLQHPGIARLIEGGVTDTGAAYIALDLVDGVPITDYARNLQLDLRHRLRLFVDICRAVDAAHRALIVHRDLKPSNVLVTADGAIKLLDFGIAKLLDADDDTQTRLPAFTPAYASPEQRSDGLITTATDVYALGVLLGELITGERLTEGSRRTPSSRVSSQHLPGILPAPANVTRRQVRGDLDNIVMKALDAEPAKRYASAGTFADDIERLLDGRPVAAHPPSAWYRTRKFASRHKSWVATAAAFVLAAIATVGIILSQSGRVKQQADRANAERDFLVSVFEAAGADLPKDKRPSIEDIVDQATSRLTAQNGLPDALRADLLLTLAKVALSVGAYDRALSLLDRAEPAIEREHGAEETDWWNARVIRASVLVAKSRRAEAIALLEPLRTQLLARRDRTGIEGVLILGNALLHQGRIDDGLALFRQAVVIAQSDAANRPDTFLAASIDEISGLMDAQRFEEGLERANAALALWHQQGEPQSQRIIDLYETIAVAEEATGDVPHAERDYQQAIALGERFFDKPNPEGAWNIGMYGSFLIAQGRLDAAEAYARRGLEMSRQVFGDADPHTLNAVARMCKLYVARKDFQSATDWCGQGVDTCHAHTVDDVVCVRLLAIRGRSYALQGRFPEADHDLLEALDAQRAHAGESTPSFAYVLDNLAVAQNAERHYEEALATTDRALSIYRAAKGGMLQAQLATRFSRVDALFGLERNDEALAEILDVEPRYTTLFPEGALRFDMLALKARALAHARRMDEARDAAHQALALGQQQKNADPRTLDELGRLADAHVAKLSATQAR